MNLTKMPGLTGLVVLVAMAFVGTSSAMAESTALCRADTSICPDVLTISHLHALGTKTTLLTSGFTIECDGLFLGDTRSSLASPLILDGTVTYSNCNLSSTKCTVTEENGPAEVKLLKLGHELADITFKLLLHAVCGSFINCRYSGEGLLGHLLGPLLSSEANGEFTVTKQSVARESGAFCPPKGEIDVVGTTLEAVYIAG